jgi:broad specificity phosphatase PhoE
MTHVVLISAGPTPWDREHRIVGNQSLPLTPEARQEIESHVTAMKARASAVYRAGANEACEQAAAIVAQAFGIRPYDNRDLEELNLGLWQGLTRSELKFRYPSTFPQWEENPQAVNPPDGEALNDAVQRLQRGVRRVLRRQRGLVVVLALRPMALQIVLGLLKGQDIAAIAGHLHNPSTIETMSIANDALHQFIA